MRVKCDWNAKIQEYKDSGMNVTAWSRSQGIPDSTFSYHLLKEKPAYGQLRVSNELKKKGVFISPGGVRSI